MKLFISLSLLLAVFIAGNVHATAVNAIIEVDDSLYINSAYCSTEPGVCYEMFRLDASWTDGIMHGTKFVSGRKIIQAIVSLDGSDYLTLMEGLFIAYGLNWEVKALQDLAATLPAFCSDSQYTDQISCEENTEVWTKAMPEVYKPVASDTLDFLVDRYIYDINGNITETQVKQVNWLRNWVGAADWISE